MLINLILAFFPVLLLATYDYLNFKLSKSLPLDVAVFTISFTYAILEFCQSFFWYSRIKSTFVWDFNLFKMPIIMSLLVLIAYPIQVYAFKNIPSIAVISAESSRPMFALMLITLFANQNFSTKQYIGFIFVLIGSILVSKV